MASGSSTTSSQPTPSSSGELDLSGEVCPFTFVRTKLALEELPSGAVLAVRVDYEPASRNVPRSVREWGHVVERVEACEGAWRIVVRKR